MLAPEAACIVARYLTVADRLLPGRITGFYVVGSAALDAWLPGRSDIDFIAVVDGGLSDREVRRLRVLHAVGNATAVEVNPVMWKVLRERGIAVRGRAPDQLGLDPEPNRLRAWNLDQLRGHWRSWARKSLSYRPPSKPLVPAHRVAVAPVGPHPTGRSGPTNFPAWPVSSPSN